MPLIKRSSPEEKEAEQKARESERAAKDAEKARERRVKAVEKLRREFFESPAGLARKAFDRGDQVFQCSLDLLSSKAYTVAMVGAYTSKPKSTADPSEILNSVCTEGWDLLDGSVVFLETGSESRDKFMRSGQQIAVSGVVMGFYLFKRLESKKQATTDPWDMPEAIDASENKERPVAASANPMQIS